MEIVDVEQNTPEWHQARLGVPTASNFGKIVTPTGQASKQIDGFAEELCAEMLMDEDDSQFSTFATRRGHELEDNARVAYQEDMLSCVELVGFVKNKGGGASPDGWVDSNGAIEIKCVMKKEYVKIMRSQDIKMLYYPQIQGQLYIGEREWCDLAVYNPSFKDGYQLFIKRVYRDEDFISKLESGVKQVIEMRDEILNQIKGNWRK